MCLHLIGKKLSTLSAVGSEAAFIEEDYRSRVERDIDRAWVEKFVMR